MNTVPYKFQLESVQRIERFGGRALLASEMGTGKSLTALLWAVGRPEVRPIVVVCPASVKWGWEREAKIHLDMRAEVLSGTRPDRGNGFPESCRIFVVNYDILRAWLPKLKELKPKLVVLDESAYIANRSARRTRAAVELCRGVPHVLALSGTPLINRPKELWSTLNVLRPRDWPAFFYYGLRYCAGRKEFFGWNFEGASNLGELHEKLKTSCLVRYRKEDVIADLPPKTRIVVPMEIDDRRQYALAVADFRAWMAEHRPEKLRSALRAECVTKLGYLLRLAASLKMPSVVSWLDDWLDGSEGKIIVFASHRAILSQLRGRYSDRSVLVDGSVVEEERQKSFDAFSSSPKIRMFLGNIKAAGVGWNGQIASSVAFVELPWSPGELVQAEDRAWRIGTRNAISVYNLVARDTMETRLCSVLHRKACVLNAVLDAGSGESLDVLGELIQATTRD